MGEPLKRFDVENVEFLTVFAGVFLGFEPAPQGGIRVSYQSCAIIECFIGGAC